MPFLDPDLDAFDVEFWDTISVIRRQQVVSNKGRGSTADTRIDGVNAVVCIASGSVLDRIPDYDIAKKYISVTGPFRLQLASGPHGNDAAGVTYKNDQVIWAGTTFEVIQLDDDSRYGQGWTEAICSSIDYQDQAPTRAGDSSAIGEIISGGSPIQGEG